jgi:NAD(P)-dependent dehydrogenase (short-subunit alcohol dehydrogenase family)
MSALPELRGKVAVVTGGASGIGKGIARQLVREGMQVVIADIEPDPLRKAADELGAVGVRADVSDLDSVRALARAATTPSSTGACTR